MAQVILLTRIRTLYDAPKIIKRRPAGIVNDMHEATFGTALSAENSMRIYFLKPDRLFCLPELGSRL